MTELFTQLGINWGALLAQTFNFLVVLVVLTVFVYRPLIRLVDARRARIEEGLAKADEADERLSAIDRLHGERMADAEREATQKIKDAEKVATEHGARLSKDAETKAESIITEAHAVAERVREQGLTTVHAEAVGLVRQALMETVRLDPSQVNEKLITQAVDTLRTHKTHAV